MSIEYIWTPRINVNPLSSIIFVYNLQQEHLFTIDKPEFINNNKSVKLSIPYEGAFYLRIRDMKQSSEVMELHNVNDPSNDSPGTTPTGPDLVTAQRLTNLEINMDSAQYSISDYEYRFEVYNSMLYIQDMLLPNSAFDIDFTHSDKWILSENAEINYSTLMLTDDAYAWSNNYPGESIQGGQSQGIALKNLVPGDSYLISVMGGANTPEAAGISIIAELGVDGTKIATTPSELNGGVITNRQMNRIGSLMFVVPEVETENGVSLSLGFTSYGRWNYPNQQGTASGLKIINMSKLASSLDDIKDLKTRIQALENTAETP